MPGSIIERILDLHILVDLSDVGTALIHRLFSLQLQLLATELSQTSQMRRAPDATDIIMARDFLQETKRLCLGRRSILHDTRENLTIRALGTFLLVDLHIQILEYQLGQDLFS